MAGFAIAAFPVFYLGPTLILIGVYSKVVYTMKNRLSDDTAPKSRSIDMAARQLTKSALVITIIFILTLGYDLTYYLLGYTGVLEYIMNSPEQKIGVLLAALNNCANPFVYMALMPRYRQRVMEAICCCSRGKLSNNTSSLNVGGSVSMSTIPVEMSVEKNSRSNVDVPI